jgi:fatty acid desaturase
VESINRFLYHALHCRIDSEYRISIAHEETDNPSPNELGEMATPAIHQLFTTTNFAPKNKIVNWYTGGLNHQIEHHIFPNISHIHYGNIAKIVKETAAECNTITNKNNAKPLLLTSNI